MRHPGSIPAELWYSHRQDISYLRPFGTIAYAHIPLDLGLSKLSPRSTRVILIGYFGHRSYKLLNRTTGAVFRSKDVIFKEGITHLAKQPTPIVFSEEDNLFPLKPDQTSKNTTKSSSKHVESQPLQLGIAPRPTIMQDLHCDNVPLSEEKLTQEQMQSEVPSMDKELSIAIRRTK